MGCVDMYIKQVYQLFVQMGALLIVLLSFSWEAQAQGQDSTPWERDLLVITEMLPGQYDNWNQYYFERRRGAPEKELHVRVHTVIQKLDSSPSQSSFLVVDYLNNDLEKPVRAFFYHLSANNDAQGVDMAIHKLDALATPESAKVVARDNRKPDCIVRWVRGAEQFNGKAVANECDDKNTDVSFQLGYEYLFRGEDFSVATLKNHPEGLSHHLARARNFECYLDYPGATGGAEIPFKRHTGIYIHDRGGRQDIEVQDGRVFRLELRNVDWKINNYEGFFSRDSLVLALDEIIDGKVELLAYAFTKPEVDRIAVNLRSVMGRCFQVSGYEQTPFF